MEAILILVIVWAAMFAASFWESRVEGRNSWGRKKLGWKLKFGRYSLPEYHFWLFFIMFPLLVFVLPLIINGWNLKLFGILVSAYSVGIVLEDFGWFVVNPVVKMKEWDSKFGDWYPWLKIKRFRIPIPYIIGILVAVLSWVLFWK